MQLLLRLVLFLERKERCSEILYLEGKRAQIKSVHFSPISKNTVFSITLKGMANAKQTLESVINNWPRDSRGWFSHYTNPGDWPSGAENSTIDTSIMVSGAIFAGNYFGGEIKTLAETLKNIPDWSTAGTFSIRAM